MAKVISVIETTDRRGLGKDESDPIRGVTQYWSLDGFLLVENDPHDFGMFERSRLREAIFQILNRTDATMHTDAAGNRFQQVFAEDLENLRATVSSQKRGA